MTDNIQRSFTLQIFKDYTIVETVASTPGSDIYRAHKNGEKKTVIIKSIKIGHSSPAALAQLKREYRVIGELNHEGIIKTLDVIDYKNTYALVLEDFGGVTLHSLICNSGSLSLTLFLQVAIQISTTLGDLHQTEIIHRDIKPDNLLINTSTGQVKLTDFGLATHFSGHQTENGPLNKPLTIAQGTPHYMSPEQTGHTNHTLDYRTDLYSLGATFYEMVTGQTPFSSGSTHSIINAHVTKSPVPPAQYNPKIPSIISDIVMKLLEKNAGDRYQNGFGLSADLKTCQQQLADTGRLSTFTLATKDSPKKFIIPDILIGRKKETKKLISVFESLCAPENALTGTYNTKTYNTKIMLISGAPGIGKSSLINQLRKPVIENQGYFIKGKFEQYRWEKPYSAIISSFQDLVRQILSEPQEKVRLWKYRLNHALGENGKIITELFPDIEFIIGAQAPLPLLGPEESRNRFRYVLQNFIQVFPSFDHPLVLCLDDLQWADVPSIQLLKDIVTNPDVKHLYFIGAYRDNELNELRHVNNLIEQLYQDGLDSNKIDLGPILPEDIQTLIDSFLKGDQSKSAEFAELLHDKTNGNPFFIIQFLQTLYHDKLITLDPRQGWAWDIELIRQYQVTDNVVKLLTKNMNKLSNNARVTLKASAAIGQQFDLETLSFVIDHPLDNVLNHLTEAVNEGFICYLPFKDSYCFNHDRIQEAAYSLISTRQQSELHYRIGHSALVEATARDEVNRRLFYIVDHLNQGYSLISNAKELEALAGLNLTAGIKAKASSAFIPAMDYLKKGLSYLSKQCWEEQYDLSLSLHSTFAEAAYLNGDYEQMETTIAHALQHTKTTLDNVGLTLSKINALKAQSHYKASVNEGLALLTQLDIKITKRPSQLQLGFHLAKVAFTLRSRSAETLLNLPAMTEAKDIAILKVISKIGISAFFVDSDLWAMIMLVGIRHTLKKGIAPESSLIFIGFGTVLSAGLRDYDQALKYGKLGFDILEKLDSREHLSRILLIYNAALHHWKLPLQDTIAGTQEGYLVGLETGDFDFAAFNLFICDLHSFLLSKNLIILEKGMSIHNRIISDLNQEYIKADHSVLWQVILHISTPIENPAFLSGDAVNAEAKVPTWIKDDNQKALGIFYFSRLSIRCFYNEYTLALDDSNTFKKYKRALRGVAINRIAVNLDSLIRLMLYPEVSFIKKGLYRIRIALNQLTMAWWCKNAPSHSQPFYHGIKAMIAWRIKNDVEKAKQHFENTINLCERPQDLMSEAYLLEHMALFYDSIGYRETARSTLLAAYRAYSDWGAYGKTAQLLRNYPDLRMDLEK